MINLLTGELKNGEPLYVAEYYKILFTYIKYKKNHATNRHVGALRLIEKGVIEKLLDVGLGML